MGFTGSPLDRCEPERADPAAAARARGEPGALLLDLDGLAPRIGADGRLGWTPLPDDLPDEELVLLGRIAGRPRYARLSPEAPPRRDDLFALLTELAPGEAATYGAARSLIDWHRRHRFCANCGAVTGLHRVGWGRACPACGTEHFPRVDPVVIMLAEHGTGAAARVLLGRQPAFPPGRYSALAGFVEPGEAVEEAVRRELAEEAGVQAGTVRYLCSQPWPFPGQLMLACMAEVDDDRLTLDRQELEDAFWATRDEVRAALARAPGARFVAPPSYAIASTLLERWLAEG